MANIHTTAMDLDPKTLRLFIAIEIDEEVRNALAKLQKKFQASSARVNWVNPENIHLTLLFLGETLSRRLSVVKASMDALVEQIGPFRFEAADIGFFGRPHSPRVIWVGVKEPSGALIRLHEELVTRLNRNGFDLEQRGYKPHLTLGRIKSRKGNAALTSESALAKNSPCGGVHVHRIVLLSSRVENKGVCYTLEHTAQLKGAVAHGN